LLLEAAPWRIALVVAAVHLVLAIIAFNPAPFFGGDNGAYYALGRALAERHAYLSLWEPGAPPHTQYPPVFPAMIAVLWMLGFQGFTAMKVLVLVCSVIAVALSYLWLRRTTTPGVALGAAALLAVMPGVIELTHIELSDMPAWAFTMLALWASTHLAGSPGDEQPGDEKRHRLWLGLFVAGVVLGNFTRAAGLPLVVAAFAWLALRRRWRDLAVLAAVFVPCFFLWWLWGKLNGSTGYLGYLWLIDPYRPQLGSVGVAEMLGRVWMNIKRYGGIHIPVLFVWSRDPMPLLGGAVTLAALVGWVRRVRRPGLAEVWVVPYLALLLLWPATWSGERFLLPLLPAFFCWGAEALRDGGRRLGGVRGARWVPLVGGALVLVLAARGIRAVGTAGRECSRQFAAGDQFPCMAPEYHDLLAIAAQAKGRLPEGSAVLSRKATLFYAISGYPGDTYPLSANPDTFLAFAARKGARYVVYDQIRDLAPLYLHPVLLARRDDFCVINGFVRPSAALLRIEVGGPRRAGVAENSFRGCPVVPPADVPP
jgi:4-amino-4-deoxy-L-arabinose transferase-like glycosyltransferase